MFTPNVNVFKRLMTRLHKKKHVTLPFRVEQSETTGNEIAMAAVSFEMAAIDTPLTSMHAFS